MKIAVTSTGTNLTAAVDPRFGRCAYFLFIETENMSVEAVANPSGELGGGAGIQSAKLASERNVKAVLTGSCGPNAHQTLSAAGISVMTGLSGTVQEAIAQYLSGELAAASGPDVESHAGMRAQGK